MHRPQHSRLLAAAVAATALAVLVAVARRERTVVTHTVGDVEAELAELDPVARAAVVAELSRDAAREIKDRR